MTIQELKTLAELVESMDEIGDPGDVIRKLIDGIYSLSTSQPLQPREAAVWVRASTRLPKESGHITWRWLDKEAAYSGYNGRGFIYDTGGAMADPLYYNEIEWLDESESPSTDEGREAK